MPEVEIGKVTHYFDRIGVAVLSLTGSIQIGDTIRIYGRATNFVQQVTSLQIEHQPVSSAKPGDDVALKVEHKVHANDKVYRIE